VSKRLAFLWALAAVLFAAGWSTAAQDSRTIDLGASDAVIELQDVLGPYHMPVGQIARPSSWYMLAVTNASQRTARRVLQAGQSPEVSLRFLPPASRPSILSVASTDPGVLVETAHAYGRHAWRVTIPPGTTASFAIEVANASAPPSVLAWTEPAIAAHNRQLGIFIAAVAGLIFAAAAIAGGLAVMTGHKPPLWAALTLLFVLLARLAATGMFDASLATRVGGPYGLIAMFSGLALAAGMRLADTIVPVSVAWPSSARWLHRGLIALVVISLLAYLGLPGATDAIDCAIVIGTAGITAYLVHRGRYGAQVARVLAPSAAVFALVALAAALTATGALGSPAVAPDIAGGFAAAGAVLLALAVVAGEGIAVLPMPWRAQAGDHPALQAIGASHQGIFDLDFERNEVHLSREAAAMIDLSEAAGRMKHSSWIARVHEDDREIYERALTDYRERNGLAFRIEFRVRSDDGHYPWFELRATMMGQGAVANRCLGLIADISTRKDAEMASADRPLRDPLTGMENRAALMQVLESLGDSFIDTAFAILDIDRFKSIHASLGDSGGDSVLVQIASRLAETFSGHARVFRFGGDSFAVLFRHPEGGSSSLGAALVDACQPPCLWEGRTVFAPASVGITVGHDARDAHDLIRNAQLALTQAKRDGGACARVYAQTMGVVAPGDSVALETELRGALQHNQLEVFYQPIVRLADSSVAGFEALLRWRHPEKGLVAPADFIAHSEETGLIVTLGAFALERAAQDLSQWQRFFPLKPALFVSVNVSRRQLRDPAFEPFLRKLLQTSGITRGTLKLEVTESAAASNAQPVLKRLRALGAGLAIDDFGTGQSSLSQLRDLPFDTVKIDQSFLARHGGTHSDSESDVVLESIVSLAHDLKRDVVVEGVESEDDERRLREIGCEFAQGFRYAAPLQLSDALNYIAQHYNPGPSASGAAGLGGKTGDVGAKGG
jgi:diguanylate cyclase (GGDEF)-like protein/PAS domain S-box-containing protein